MTGVEFGLVALAVTTATITVVVLVVVTILLGKLRHRGEPSCSQSFWYLQAARHCRSMHSPPFPSSAFTEAKMPSSNTSLFGLMTRTDLFKEIETNFADP